VTPLQLAHSASIIAARGRIWKPRLVTGFRDPRSGAVRRLAPVPDGEVKGITPADWERVIRDMVGVTQRGTAAAIGAHAPYTFGGKTGTAQVFTVARTERYNARNISERLRDHSWFIAFAPADSPRIALAVIEENGGAGASAAAPIARKVMDAYLLDADGRLKPAPARTAAPAAAPAVTPPQPTAPPAAAGQT
jgi:penicillin-binding protein 2